MQVFATKGSLVTWSIVGLFGLMLAGAFVASTYARSHAPAPVLTGALSARESYWSARISRVGEAHAYEEFAAAVAPLPSAKQHENAHAFGGALFAAAGLSGIATCDARFNYGCYHEFLGRAIAGLGLGVVPELNDACRANIKKSPLSCQHGIGHGIMAAEGYDEAALKKSLTICKSLPGIDTIGGCYGGVFMEYNMQTMLGDEARTRAPHAGDPYYPCTSLEETYQGACAFWSPQWWGALGYDSTKIGTLCDGLSGATLIRDCYQGLGVDAPTRTGYDPQKTAALCTRASKDRVRELYCLAYAANALNVGGGGEANGIAVCSGLAGAALSYCTAYAKNEANQAAELPAIEKV